MEEKKKVSKAQQKAVNKWIEKTYDRINLTVPKGKQPQIKAHASAKGESVNGFINRAIDETIASDNGVERSGGTMPVTMDTIAKAAAHIEGRSESLEAFFARSITETIQRDQMADKLK